MPRGHEHDRSDGGARATGHVRAGVRRLFRLAVRRRDLRRDDVDDEVRLHVDLRVEQLVRRGLSEAAARAQAAEWFAGTGNTLEDAARDLRASAARGETRLARHEWVADLGRDLRLAARSLRRAPAFAATVVVTLALGIGANTAIFSVVRGVLLKPLPHRDGDRLVYLRQSTDVPGGANVTFSVPEVRDLRHGAPSLGGIAEYSPWTAIHQGDDGAARIDVALVTGNYFEVMGLRASLGRLTRPSDDGPGVPPVAVLTHDFWLERFGGDSSVVGRPVRLDGRPVTVIGVLQPAPFFPDRVDALLNMVMSEHHLSAAMVEGRSHRMTEVVARLAPGATLERARSEVAAVHARMQREHRSAYDPASHYRVAVVPFREAIGERARLTLRLLMGAAAFVLVIAVANVANLALMRGVRREHELALRAALGAGRTRLRRLLLVEHLVLTLLGALLGVVVAVGGVGLLGALVERYSPRAREVRLDAVVFGFLLALSAAVALLLSALPSLPGAGGAASRVLAGAHRTSGSPRRQRLQRALVVVQVAVSVVLLAGAGLLTRTMLRLADVDTGLRSGNVLTMQVSLLTPSELLSDPAADVGAKVRYARMRDDIAALPGVVDVGIGFPLPLRGSGVRFDVRAEGRPAAVGEAARSAELRTADPRLFHAAGIPLLRGRPFAETDGPGAGRVVIVNSTLARTLFPDADPLGKRIAWTGEVLRFSPLGPEWRTIVGVVGDTRDGGLDAAPRPAVYMPFAQFLAIGGGLVIRTDGDVPGLATAATRIVRRIAPSAPVEQVMTIAQYKDRSVAPRRVNAALVSAFGVLAAIVAAVGIAGVVGFSVSARTNEIGIRMSLGAHAGRVQRMILREGGVLLAAGLALGVAGALAAARVMQGLLFHVAPHDPATFAGVALAMAAIGVAACWIPALRAARVDPAITMRSS